jgi:5-hydroxyisourate hydrolase-like protein (transthyretin family)
MDKKIVIVMVLLSSFLNTPVLALESREVNVDFSMNPAPKVGVPTELSFVVKDEATGKPINDVKINVGIVIVEDALKLFSGDFYSKDGKLRMTYHFQDASEHAINLKISPTALSKVQFQPLTKTFLTEVELPEPPTKVWFKTWVFLMGLLVIGIAVGFYAVKFRAKNAA